MPRTCPKCGTRAIDDQSQFCNKCGTPFPAEEQAKKVFVRTVPKMVADTPPPPPPPQPVQQYSAAPPAPEYYSPPPPAPQPQVRPAPAPRRPRAPVRAKPLAPERPGIGGFLRFETFITTRNFMRLLYLAGVIAIILVAGLGIMSGPSKTTAASADAGDAASTTAKETDSTTNLIMWAGFLIFGNLLWRIMCEMLVVLFVMNDSLLAIKNTLAEGTDALFEDSEPEYGTGTPGAMAECPRCGKTVPAEDLRSCEVCGTQGCTSCIRLMGLVRKKWTCRDCFERK